MHLHVSNRKCYLRFYLPTTYDQVLTHTIFVNKNIKFYMSIHRQRYTSKKNQACILRIRFPSLLLNSRVIASLQSLLFLSWHIVVVLTVWLFYLSTTPVQECVCVCLCVFQSRSLVCSQCHQRVLTQNMPLDNHLTGKGNSTTKML